MAAPNSAEEIRKVNIDYHDLAADQYDSKWGIDFGETGQKQVVLKLRKALGANLPDHFKSSLEIGAGTGYFTLNLMQAGMIKQATCSDISPGMLKTLSANANTLGLKVKTAVADAEQLPFADESFDLVIGHAVLHHIPDLECAFNEFMRVLKPGGVVVFCGEPSRFGDLVATVPKRGASAVAPLWRRLVGASALQQPEQESIKHNENRLEKQVDVHAFMPGQLKGFARKAGLTKVRVVGEELLANWFGWSNRSLEASAEPSEIPAWWQRYAFHGYLALQQVDGRALEGKLPAEIFYNLMISARKPAS